MMHTHNTVSQLITAGYEERENNDAQTQHGESTNKLTAGYEERENTGCTHITR